MEARDAHLDPSHLTSKYITSSAFSVHGSPFLLGSLGAILDEQPLEGETLEMKGSVLVAVAESREEALKIVKEDVYSTQGVWDVEKLQIYPVGVKLSDRWCWWRG